jgi:hypothetical protein
MAGAAENFERAEKDNQVRTLLSLNKDAPDSRRVNGDIVCVANC